ncbi:MAG TPA: phosphopantetheine-binding protein, partial [Thermoanaerobaculia bacterium]|nr:phosphopantetheine-binding protein [Thermoanaerobaculia bacterium]
AAGLRDALRAKLPAYMVPAGFVLLDRLPVTPNAKVDRRALARLAPGPDGLDAALEGTFVEPEGDLEGRIAAVWREVLGLERVGVRHNFFDLGGHSLLLVRLHARLQETLGRELSLVDLFNYPSIRALADHLGQAASQTPAPEVVEVAQDRAQKQIEAARRQRELARARRPR